MSKEKVFDALMMVLMGAFMMAVIWFGFVELYVKFAVMPMVIFYFLGKYSQRKFGAKAEKANR